MLVNNSSDHNDLTEGAIRQLKKNVNGGHYLCIQDTTEINFTLTWEELAGRTVISVLLKGGERPIQVFLPSGACDSSFN